jgi:hypothetical protein
MSEKPGDRLRKAFLEERPAIPPELFRALFLEEDEAGVIRELCGIRRNIRKEPLACQAWGLKPWGGVGRPKGARTGSLVQQGPFIVMAVDWCGLRPSQAIRFLKEAPTLVPSPKDYAWLKRRLAPARKALPKLLAENPFLATVKAAIEALSPDARKACGKNLLLKARRLA